ncbi:hypothetical protein H5154_01045 [Pseudoalteromonas sp. SR44-5]|uniref:hypothetical protein n=1 Tax=Pseudoalteromonas sp. SR44-5 TaxID=2760934 RepID=UPI001603FAA5|nr:hypothetical protein [Pseudoalteromonas sp. SR44-5]MBB1364984.1 hypothetical protein [Pseudoalteromonas sp. SR44-5]
MTKKGNNVLKLEDVNAESVYIKILGLATFAKSVLHLPFPKLDDINPSFEILHKYCDLAATILENEAHDGMVVAQEIMRVMGEIAKAIIERDDQILVDCMAHLDEIICNNKP